MEENTSLHTECAHKPRPAVLNQFSRTELLLGEDNMQRLFNARVAVFGIGGVGGYTVEALARVGVGTLDLIDECLFYTSDAADEEGSGGIGGAAGPKKKKNRGRKKT